MICGLCLQQTEHLVKSHIIPKAIMIDGLNHGERLAIASTIDHPKKSQTGAWSRIVCDTCEKSFGKDDEYLVWFYRTIDSFPVAFEGHATELTGVDSSQLRRSILSVVFRAHLSDHAMFNSVSLGPYAEGLRQFVHKDRPQIPAGISVALRHITSSMGGALLDPSRETFEGINIYRFYFPRFTALIRVDKRSVGYPFLEMELGRTTPGYAMRFTRFSPSEIRVIMKILRRNQDGIRKALRQTSS